VTRSVAIVIMPAKKSLSFGAFCDVKSKIVIVRPYSHEPQYCDKKIILRHRVLFTNQGKILKKYLDLFCLFIYLNWFICQELTLAYWHPLPKYIFLSQYLFIAILSVKMSRVHKPLISKVQYKTDFFALAVDRFNFW